MVDTRKEGWGKADNPCGLARIEMQNETEERGKDDKLDDVYTVDCNVCAWRQGAVEKKNLEQKNGNVYVCLCRGRSFTIP